MRTLSLSLVFIALSYAQHEDGTAMQHRSLMEDEENLLAADRQQLPEVKSAVDDSSVVSQRQFYRPGSNYNRPTYNYGLHSPIRTPYIPRPPISQIYRPIHPSNNAYYEPPVPIGYIPPPVQGNGYPSPDGYLNNIGQPHNHYARPDDVPYINFQSIGPNGRPALTYLSPNFGFFFRNKNAATEGSESGIEQTVENSKVSSTDSITFESKR